MYVGVSCRADRTLEFLFWLRAFSSAYAPRRLRRFGETSPLGEASPLSEERNGSESRHQRIRANRPQHHAGGARQQGHRLRRGERLDQRRDACAPAEVRLGARQPEGEGRSAGRRHRCRRRCLQGGVVSRPGAASMEGSRRRRRVRINRSLHRPRCRGQAHHRRRQARRDHGPREGPRHHGRHGRESREVRSGEAPDHLERVVHDELSRSAWQRCCTRSTASGRAG